MTDTAPGACPGINTGTASLIAERLCHDFAGLAGMIAGALTMAAEGEPDALSLAQEAASTLVARLRLARAAWGGACGDLDATALAALCAGLQAGPPAIQLAAPLPEAEARAALCILLLASAAAPPRASLTLAALPTGGLAVTSDQPFRPLAPTDPPTVRAVPLLLAQEAARACAWRILATPETLRLAPA